MTGNVGERKFAPTDTVKILKKVYIISKTSVVNRMKSSDRNHLRNKEIFILLMSVVGFYF